MSFARRLVPRTVAAQIACLVIVAVLLGVGSASAALLYLLHFGQPAASPEIMAAARAARIATLVKEAQATRSPGELAHVLKAAQWRVMDVEVIPIARLTREPSGAEQGDASTRLVKGALEDTWGIVALADGLPTAARDSVVVKISDDDALVFRSAPRSPLLNFVLVQSACALAAIIVIVLFLSLYAVRWITSPLSSIALAARSFGHSPVEDGTLSPNGPREIAQVAEALNDMRKRVRSLVDERTQMLAAISHDLRTPLTRLRLRTERLSDGAARDGMLRDIATINDMLSETLAYLREGGQLEPVLLADVPSLLQTICAQFTDFGHDVTYQGPDRFAFSCRAHALNRAVTNIVDNGVKHGFSVIVGLQVLSDKTVQIEISDDGPGIPPQLREKVFEPFFKGDSARPSSGRGGFGLGLSIARDIVRRHAGTIELINRMPQGLTVRLCVAAQAAGKVADVAAPASA